MGDYVEHWIDLEWWNDYRRLCLETREEMIERHWWANAKDEERERRWETLLDADKPEIYIFLKVLRIMWTFQHNETEMAAIMNLSSTENEGDFWLKHNKKIIWATYHHVSIKTGENVLWDEPELSEEFSGLGGRMQN